MAKQHTFVKRPGSVEVICGPMFAGKTDELIRRLRKWEYADVEYIIFKPKMDTRQKNIQSRNNLSRDAVEIVSAFDILDILISADKNYDVVAVDECQFFNNDLVPVCDLLAKHGYVVIVAGLDRDFKGEPFGPIPNLLTNADKVTKLTAICDQCGSDATLTQRLIDGVPASYYSSTILVGDSESYCARCRHCHKVPDKPLSTLEQRFVNYTGKLNSK